MPRPVIALVLIILSAAAIACSSTEATSGNGTPVPNDTPVIGTQVPTSNCPVAVEVCTLAEDVLKAAQAKDFSPIVANGAQFEYVCPAQPQGLGGPFPLCDGAPVGQKRFGFPLAYLQSEGIVVTPAGLVQSLNRWAASAQPAKSDSFGDGSIRLVSVACPADAKACGDNFAVLLTNLGEVPYRMYMILFFKRIDGQPRLTWSALGPMLDPREESVMMNGGNTPNFFRFEGWPHLNTIYPLKR